jgi:hypothetical protein
MAIRNNEYTELSRAKTHEKRNVIISKDNYKKTLVSLAQQIVVEEGNKRTEIFLKGAITIQKDKLVNLRDAINEALAKLEDEE